MPIYLKIDLGGNFFQFGNFGKKYYFDPYNINSIKKAKNKAKKQAQAIHANKSKLK